MSEADIQDLLRRVRKLEAVREIEQLKYRYWRACDRKDPDGFRDCFVARGADLDYGVIGRFSDREPLAEVFRQIGCGKTEGGAWLVHDIHHGKQPVIELLDDANASGEWTLWFVGVVPAKWRIVEVAPDYSWALADYPGRDMGWVLARDPIMDDTLYQDLVKRARDHGINARQLVRIPQVSEQVGKPGFGEPKAP